MVVKEEIEIVEQNLWEQVKSMTSEELSGEVTEWVMDLSLTIGCLST